MLFDLNWLDMLGRRPVPQTEPSGTEPSETAPPSPQSLVTIPAQRPESGG